MDYSVITSELTGLSLSITMALVAVVMGIPLLLEAVRSFQLNKTEGFQALCEEMDREVVDFHEVHAASITQGRSLFQAPEGLLEHHLPEVVEPEVVELEVVEPEAAKAVVEVFVQETFVTNMTALEEALFSVWESPVLNR